MALKYTFQQTPWHVKIDSIPFENLPLKKKRAYPGSSLQYTSTQGARTAIAHPSTHFQNHFGEHHPSWLGSKQYCFTSHPWILQSESRQFYHSVSSNQMLVLPLPLTHNRKGLSAVWERYIISTSVCQTWNKGNATHKSKTLLIISVTPKLKRGTPSLKKSSIEHCNTNHSKTHKINLHTCFQKPTLTRTFTTL